MKSYTINLTRSFDRRLYVEKEIAKVPFINNEYVEGVDGSLLSGHTSIVFNEEEAQMRYGRVLKLGEIGCTLSHRKCYKRLLKSDDNVAIIFEDDILIRCFAEETWQKIYDYINNQDKPLIILLSGGYWYKGRNVDLPDLLVSVYSAYFTHSYIVNRAAAELILSLDPSYLADDWRLFTKAGVRLYGVNPHLVDQQWNGTVPSMIQNEAKEWFDTLALRYKLKSYLKMVPCKLLEIIGHHENNSFDNFSQI